MSKIQIERWGNVPNRTETEYRERASFLHERNAFSPKEIGYAQSVSAHLSAKFRMDQATRFAVQKTEDGWRLSEDGHRLAVVHLCIWQGHKTQAAVAKLNWLREKELYDYSHKFCDLYRRLLDSEIENQQFYLAGWTATILNSMYRQCGKSEIATTIGQKVLIVLTGLEERDVFLEAAVHITTGAAYQDIGVAKKARYHVSEAQKLVPNSLFAERLLQRIEADRRHLERRDFVFWR